MTSTNTPITPEIVRAVAEWCSTRCSDGHHLSGRLMRESDRLELEQADAELIDRYARASFAAEHAHMVANAPAPTLIDWDGSTELQRDVTRAGVRALLALLESEGRLVAEGETVEADPQAWGDLGDVPKGVDKVRRFDGRVFSRSRTVTSDWLEPDGSVWNSGSGPFVEVIEPVETPHEWATLADVSPGVRVVVEVGTTGAVEYRRNSYDAWDEWDSIGKSVAPASPARPGPFIEVLF